MHKQYTPDDVNRSGPFPRIATDNFREDLEYTPPAWMQRGLQETASGYGKRLNSGYCIHYAGKRYRVYITQFSNAGTAWFTAKGERIIVS